MIYKVYFCKDCNAASREPECIVCGKPQKEIGWYETTETGDSK